MKMIRKVLALVLALVLTMSVAAFPAAQADTAMKSEHGAFAAESAALGRIFMILPTEAGSTLYSMASNGGTVKMIESAPQINDVIADASGNVYYLCYTGSVFQAVARNVAGERIVLAQFNPGQLAYSLSLYNGTLYCLVDNKFTRIDMNGAGAETVSGRMMVSYTIANEIVYYQSAEDEASYEKPYTRGDGTSLVVTTASGKLYAMNIDGTSDMQQFSQGVSNLAAYGEYIYFHNYNDSYVVDGNPDAWLDGKLYRLNVQTNQFKQLRDGYDWNYRPVDLGLVIYQQNSLSISAQDGTNPVQLYAPDPYNYLVLMNDCAIVYEYNLQKLTRVPYNGSGAVQLWSGPFVTDGTVGDVIDGNVGTPDNSTTPDDTTTTPDNTGNTGSTGNTGTTGNTGSTGNTGNTGSTVVTLRYGNSGNNVRSMQNKLVSLGYLNSADGIFGDATLSAVKRFQRNAGLTADGVAGAVTLDALSDAAAYATTALRQGNTGTRVRQMQVRLKDLGYLKSVDGVFGNDTLSAVKDFQKAAGLTVDGVAGQATIKKLNSASAPKADDAGDSSYIFPNSNKKKLTESQILAVNKSLWPYARNEIYARHGYSFKNTKYEKYFESKSWYKEGGFSTKDLNSVEWYNMELLLEMEKKYGTSSSTPDYEEEYIFPNSSKKKLTKAEIRAVDSELWSFARNEIYARHGYKFTTAKYKKYFESKSWYKAGGFSTKDLNSIEWYNMELIRWMEEHEK